MKFDFAIGNPPYQEDNENSVRKSPVYNDFMDAAFVVANTVELITPGRFLFDAGQTPKEWNKKMLSDEHFKVLHYENDASRVFPATDIKGGVIISLHDSNKVFGKISVFTPFEELNKIYQKVSKRSLLNLDTLVSQRGMYRLCDKFFVDFPNATSQLESGTGNMIVSNIFGRLPEAFLSEKPVHGDYIKILGRANNSRAYRYIKSEYVLHNEFIDKYKLFFPEANSNGQFGEVLTLPEIGRPFEGATDTFLNIGLFDSEYEALSLLKYIKSKFLRALLGIKKATQHTPRPVWDTIPVQDFTDKSDIDWSKSVKEIDQQLYRKYALKQDEIGFIESKVKEME